MKSRDELKKKKNNYCELKKEDASGFRTMTRLSTLFIAGLGKVDRCRDLHATQLNLFFSLSLDSIKIILSLEKFPSKGLKT